MKKIIPLIILLVVGGVWFFRVTEMVETTQQNAATDLNNEIVTPLIDAVEVFDSYEEMLFRTLQATTEERKGMITLLSLGGSEVVEEALQSADASLQLKSYETGSPESDLYNAALTFLGSMRKLLPQYEKITEKVLDIENQEESAVFQVFSMLQDLQLERGEAMDEFSAAQESYFD